MLALPASLSIHNVFCVSLIKKYILDANHVIGWNVIQVEKEGDFRFQLVCILDRKFKTIWNRAVGLVNIKWMYYDPEDETWENEDAMRTKYPHLFEKN